MDKKAIKDYILNREDVKCLKEYGTPIVKGKITGIAKKAGTWAGTKAGKKISRVGHEKTKALEAVGFIAFLKFALEKADGILNKPPKKPSKLKTFRENANKWLIKNGLKYDIDTAKKLKKFEKQQKKKLKKLQKKLKKKSPLKFRLPALGLMPVIEKLIK